LQEIDQLLNATARGDKTAFRDLYHAIAPQLFAVALRILKRRDWAEDVLQESFTTIWQRAGDFRPELGSSRAWMTVILRNRALDRLRRVRPVAEITAEMLEQIPDDAASPLEATMRGSEARRLHGCLDRLDATQRRAILAAYFDGFTHEELAQRLAAPIGTVKSWIRRGLMRLKGCLEL
jgi:RNA polymerase sigma-70 factor (ECF subfamily)